MFPFCRLHQTVLQQFSWNLSFRTFPSVCSSVFSPALNCSFDSCLNKGRCSKCSPCQLFIVTTATPVSFETEVTLRFDGGRIFFNTEFLKLVVYFHFATSLGDNYIGIEGNWYKSVFYKNIM